MKRYKLGFSLFLEPDKYRDVPPSARQYVALREPHEPSFNYTQNAVTFAHVYDYASQGKVRIQSLDLKVRSATRSLANDLQARKEQLSLVDVSNAWWKGFVGPSRLGKVLTELKEVTTPSTLLLLTTQANGSFFYFATPLEKVNSAAAWKRFSKDLEILNSIYADLTSWSARGIFFP